MARMGMVRDLDGDFDHPSVPEGSPLRRHVLFRRRRAGGRRGFRWAPSCDIAHLQSTA